MSSSPTEQELQALLELYRQGKPETALAQAVELLQRHPGIALLHNLVGVITASLGRPAEAIASYDAALAIEPGHADAWNNRGNALRRLGRHGEALESFDRAVSFEPASATAHFNRGAVLQELGRPDAAVGSFDQALALRPDHAATLRRRAAALADLGRADAALVDHDRAIALAPDHAETWARRGDLLFAAGSPEKALASYEQALAIDPDNAEVHAAAGNVHRSLEQPGRALDSYDRALRIKPDFHYALVRKLSLASYVCDWPALASIDLASIGLAQDPVPPFAMLLVDDDPGRNLVRARRWSTACFAGINPAEPAQPRRPGKIRIGYFSADFHAHATMVLMASLLELHDHAQFEIHAFSYGPEVPDGMRDRLRSAVAQFHDVRILPDAEVAALSRSAGIDIAVDLKGFTQGGRPGIFAHRAAPIQVNFLGYPGTMGAHFIDYMIADHIVVPDHLRQFYAEKIIRLPGSYQVNDERRQIAARPFGRSELGLPEDGFVFCCFNNTYKITPAEFDVWARLLGRVERSVLWLLRDNPFSEANLRREAAARGLAPERLVFADRMPLPEHLARHRCADLFLDTFACNAHTTASDALWAGLPIVSRQGEGFPARVASSVLHACGLPELVTTSPVAYESLALALATDPARLAAIKARLAVQRDTAPLFDAQTFARNIEAGFRIAHDRLLQGLPPDHIDVPAS